MTFEFATAGRILFGEGVRRQVAQQEEVAGKRILLVTGPSRRHTDELVEDLKKTGATITHVTVSGEPDLNTVDEGLRVARDAQCESVIGLGGGSVIDTAKVISGLLTNPGELMDYLEVIGKGQKLTRPAAPYIAIPTTAGTGAEVTRNAVIGVPEHRVKVSIRHAYLLPRLAVIDPELTYDLPRNLTAATGLDALTQLMEVFVSHTAQPMTDAVCREGLRRATSLQAAWQDGHNAPARADMCVAALCSGMALANAKLGAVHGIAGPLGGMANAPHGAVCARLLPFVMETNIQALRARHPEHRALERYREVAHILTGQPNATVEGGIQWVQALCEKMDVPPLRTYGLQTADLSDLIAKSRKASSMQGNPIELTDQELMHILNRAF